MGDARGGYDRNRISLVTATKTRAQSERWRSVARSTRWRAEKRSLLAMRTLPPARRSCLPVEAGRHRGKESRQPKRKTRHPSKRRRLQAKKTRLQAKRTSLQATRTGRRATERSLPAMRPRQHSKRRSLLASTERGRARRARRSAMETRLPSRRSRPRVSRTGLLALLTCEEAKENGSPHRRTPVHGRGRDSAQKDPCASAHRRVSEKLTLAEHCRERHVLQMSHR